MFLHFLESACQERTVRWSKMQSVIQFFAVELQIASIEESLYTKMHVCTQNVTICGTWKQNASVINSSSRTSHGVFQSQQGDQKLFKNDKLSVCCQVFCSNFSVGAGTFSTCCQLKNMCHFAFYTSDGYLAPRKTNASSALIKVRARHYRHWFFLGPNIHRLYKKAKWHMSVESDFDQI